MAQEQQTGVRRFDREGVWHDHVYWPADRFRDAFLGEVRHFVECVRLNREPQVSGSHGRAALSLALTAQRSSRQGRQITTGRP